MVERAQPEGQGPDLRPEDPADPVCDRLGRVGCQRDSGEPSEGVAPVLGLAPVAPAPEAGADGALVAAAAE
jgi:hypothetical protein